MGFSSTIYICFCFEQIRCLDVILEDADVAKALTEYLSSAAIQNLVLGASRHGFIRSHLLIITTIKNNLGVSLPANPCTTCSQTFYHFLLTSGNCV